MRVTCIQCEEPLLRWASVLDNLCPQCMSEAMEVMAEIRIIRARVARLVGLKVASDVAMLIVKALPDVVSK